MGLERVLEEELMDTSAEAEAYDTMDHSTVNCAFAEDLIAFAKTHAKPLGDILDLGTGTAQIPLVICELDPDVRIMATDLAASMLDLAVYNVECCDVSDIHSRLQLAQADAKNLEFSDEMFDTVISNSIVHHLPEPFSCLEHSVRVCKPGGILFFRDLLRPESNDEVTELVQTYAGKETAEQQKLFDDSLRAALTLDEIRGIIGRLGYDAETVTATTDRHWTWSAIRD